MLRFRYYLSRSEQQPFRNIILILLFCILGFSFAFSSVDVFPFIFIHESGHYLAARIVDVQLEKNDSHSYSMYLVKDEPIKNYVRVLRGGYKAEIFFWYVIIGFVFLINLRRIKRGKNGFHYPAALFPGYVLGLLSTLRGTTDIQAIAGLTNKAEVEILRRIIFEEVVWTLLVSGLYIGGLILSEYLIKKRIK